MRKLADSNPIAEKLAELLDLPIVVARLMATVERLERRLAKREAPAVDIHTAAERLGISVATARRRVKDGTLQRVPGTGHVLRVRLPSDDNE